jgi:hypothetical protein
MMSTTGARVRVCSGVAAALLGLTLLSPPARAEIRRLPFPFGQMITFASDVDAQAPWHTRAIHRHVNEDLGLPIGDSTWIASALDAADQSAFFRSFQELNNRSAGFEGHTIYGILLREWHRGNIDHIHSWTDDGIPQYHYRLPTPFAITAEAKESIQIPAAKWLVPFEAVGRGSQQLRLIFDKVPPDDLTAIVQTVDGSRYVFPPHLVQRYRSGSAEALAVEPTVTLVLREPWPVGAVSGSSASLSPPAAVQLSAASCAANCTVNLVGVERDNFSRWSVARQKTWLDYFNVRPAVFTSHGGYHYHQDFEGPGEKHYMPVLNFGDFVRKESIGLAARPFTHGYHADLLKQLGVRSVTSIWNPAAEEYSAFNKPAPGLRTLYSGFYLLAKTHVLLEAGVGPIPKVSQELVNLDPAATDFDLNPLLCEGNLYCRVSSQGGTVGALIALGRHMIRKGRAIENNWYTHFGTARQDPTFKVSMEEPFKPTTMAEFRNLALDYYDPRKELPENHRVWVPPAAVWANYRIMRDRLAEHMTVDPATSEVRIASFMEPVLQEILPNPKAGTRDLHGITIYVPSAERARVLIDGSAITTFTRNRADASGRESITIVDDNTPATVFNVLSPAATGSIATTQASAEWVAHQNSADDGPRSFLRLRADGAAAAVTLRPHDLAFWNITHLAWSHRLMRSDARQPTAQLSLTFEMDDGVRIAIAEGSGSAPPADADTGLWLSPTVADDLWRHTTIAQTEFVWKPDADKRRKLPLLIGKIRSVVIKLNNASPGDTLEIGAMRGLRPSGNGVAPDQSLLLSGRVMDSDGSPAVAVNVKARIGDEVRETTTDASGYYFFGGVKRGQPAWIAARVDGRVCGPKRPAVETWTNEAELDIDLAECT